MDIRRRPPNPSVKVSSLEYSIPHEEGEPRNILEKILWQKDREIASARDRVPLEGLKSQIADLPPTKDFLSALKKTSQKPAVIAEIKKASPSKGIIRKDFDPISISLSYKRAGAACISVLTDKVFFKGGFEVLINVRKAIDLPILCKEFIISPYQLYQARAAGADAALLIAAILSDQDLHYLNKVARSLGLNVLVEVHNEEEMKRVLNTGHFPLIGINNRDLTTFKTDLSVTESLIEKYSTQIQQQGILLVSESGLKKREDLKRVNLAGAKAVLIGESLMSSSDIESKLKQLINNSTNQE